MEEKDRKKERKGMILTSEQGAEHPFAGRNTQHIVLDFKQIPI